MTWVLVRDDGAYVAPAGSHKAYTRKLEQARHFTSRESAQSHCCENERPVRLEDAGR